MKLKLVPLPLQRNKLSSIIKNTIVLIICIIASITNIQAQTCLPGGIEFTTQEQIDNFATDYPICTEILGNVTINFTPITNLSGLSSLTSINGNLSIIVNDALTSLSGLDNLTSIGGNLSIDSNNSLTNLSGLESLDRIGGSLSLGFTTALTSLNGLNNLTQVSQDLVMQDGDGVINMNGLNSLDTIGGNLFIWDNNALTSLSGLDNLVYIGGGLGLDSNNELIDLLGLNSVFSVGNLVIGNHSSLSNLDGLNNLSIINDITSIYSNEGLVNLNGLNNVSSFNGNLNISDNNQLSFCSVNSICDYLINGGPATIQNNGSGCSTVDDIIFGCGPLAKLYHPIFYDLNENGLFEQGEPFYSPASVLIAPGNITSYGNEINGGIEYLSIGDYSVTYNQANTPDWNLTTDSISYQISLEDADNPDTVYFGIYPNSINSGMESIVASQNFRCNEYILFDIYGENTGTTTILNGTLWLTLDSEILDTVFVDPPDTLGGTNEFGWHFTSLYPGNAIHKQIRLQIPGPPDFPLGEFLTFISKVDYT